MQVIYNRETAIQTKQKIDAETPELNRKAKKRNRLRLCVCILGYFCFSFVLLAMGRFLKKIFLFDPLILSAGVMAVILVLVYTAAFAYHLYDNWREWILSPIERYPMAVSYHCATQDQTILEYHEGGINRYPAGDKADFTFVLVLENTSLITECEFHLERYKLETRSDSSELTINLDTETISVPYNKED